MTVLERPSPRSPEKLSIEQFEVISRTAAREDVTLEYLGGYLLVDRDDDNVTVHSEPHGGRYRNIATLGYGHTVGLADLEISLNTDGLKRCSG